jgi:hypothetical protein
MKFDPNQPIEEILKAFVEETCRREKEDRELCEYLQDFVPTPYPPSQPRGLDEVWSYLRWSITSSGAIDRSCFDEQLAAESQFDSFLDLAKNDDHDRL